MSSIKVQGSLEPHKAYKLADDESKLLKIACAQVFPSENGINGEGGLDKLEAYTKEAAGKGADGVYEWRKEHSM